MVPKPTVVIAIRREDARTALAAEAERAGFAVKTTGLGDELFELFRTFIPDALILDLRLPNADAIQVIHRLSKFALHPFLILVGDKAGGMLDVVQQIAVANGLPVAGTLSGAWHSEKVQELLDKAHAEIPAKTTYGEQSLMMQLAQAIPNDELYLVYQPLVEIAGRRITGVEALVRWNHPTRGELIPDRFITLAEYSGIIVPMTWWVLQTAIKQHADWKKQGLVLPVSVNISAGFLTSVELADVVLRLLQNYGGEPRHLTLEITETDVVGNPTLALEILARFRLAGVKVAMDDYGVGFSNLTQLQQYPFSDLKIDRWMIEKLPTDKEQQEEIKLLVRLAGAQDVAVTGEGIETEEQWSALEATGCKTAQGYLIARPMLPLKIPGWIAAEANRFNPPLP